MPYKDEKTRMAAYDYKKTDGTPEAIKKRDARNKARRMLMKEGKVHVGDGMDVDHKQPMSKGGKTVLSNLRVRTEHDNRSFPRRADHAMIKNVVDKKPKKK